MASKQTTKTTPAKRADQPKKAKAAPVPARVHQPKARLANKHGSKAELAKALAPIVALPGEDSNEAETRLVTASNAQLLRLHQASETMKAKFGSRDQLVAAISNAKRKTTDKDYLAKLDTFSLPQLLELAASAKRARA